MPEITLEVKDKVESKKQIYKFTGKLAFEYLEDLIRNKFKGNGNGRDK
jgi:hypothetical protein